MLNITKCAFPLMVCYCLLYRIEKEKKNFFFIHRKKVHRGYLNKRKDKKVLVIKQNCYMHKIVIINRLLSILPYHPLRYITIYYVFFCFADLNLINSNHRFSGSNHSLTRILLENYKLVKDVTLAILKLTLEKSLQQILCNYCKIALTTFFLANQLCKYFS